MHSLETINWMNKKEYVAHRPRDASRPPAWNDIEYTFYKWLGYHGHYMNFKTELKRAGLSYKGIIDMIVKSYLEDPKKNAYQNVISIAFDFTESLYGAKYWTNVHLEWRKYASGESSI